MGLQCQLEVVRIDTEAVTTLDVRTERFSDMWNALFLDLFTSEPVFPERGQHEDELPDPEMNQTTFGHTWVTREEIKNADYSSHMNPVNAQKFREHFDEYFIEDATHLFIHFER